jgi:dolichol-phosphate mannosyltransferase
VPTGGLGRVGELGHVLVVVPTYNESGNLERIVARLLEAVPSAHVLVADDNSPDGTGEIADRLAAEDSRVHVLHRPVKEGLGRAYVAGFRWGLARDYDVICEMDADGSHPPEQLPELLAALENADLVLGSRWVPGGRVENWPRTRELFSRSANLYTRIALGMPLRDATAGFRAYRRATIEAIDLDNVASLGYAFQIDLALRAIRAGFRVVEVPIVFTEREFGRSKMSRREISEALTRVTVWGVRHRAHQLRERLGRPKALSPRE